MRRLRTYSASLEIGKYPTAHNIDDNALLRFITYIFCSWSCLNCRHPNNDEYYSDSSDCIPPACDSDTDSD
jgi:hypothetical protein